MGGVLPDLGEGTWWERNVPSICTPSTTPGPVQPFGVRRMTAGQRTGRNSSPPAPPRASCWMARIRAWAAVSALCRAVKTAAGSSPATTTGSQPWAASSPTTSASSDRPSTVGPEIL